MEYENTNANETTLTREDAIDELGYDNFQTLPYDLFSAVGAKLWVDEPKVVCVYPNSNELDEDYWKEGIDLVEKIANWVGLYKKLNKGDRLSVSDIVVSGVSQRHIHGSIIIDNGLNGITHVSKQSLKHVLDLITYLEDYYGARAWISFTSMHSDCFVYSVSFVIWKSHIDEAEKDHVYGNLKPLCHWDY